MIDQEQYVNFQLGHSAEPLPSFYLEVLKYALSDGKSGRKWESATKSLGSRSYEDGTEHVDHRSLHNSLTIGQEEASSSFA